MVKLAGIRSVFRTKNSQKCFCRTPLTKVSQPLSHLVIWEGKFLGTFGIFNSQRLWRLNSRRSDMLPGILIINSRRLCWYIQQKICNKVIFDVTEYKTATKTSARRPLFPPAGSCPLAHRARMTSLARCMCYSS